MQQHPSLLFSSLPPPMPSRAERPHTKPVKDFSDLAIEQQSRGTFFNFRPALYTIQTDAPTDFGTQPLRPFLVDDGNGRRPVTSSSLPVFLR